MISIHLEGQTVSELHSQMVELLAGTAAVAGGAVAEPKSTGRGKKDKAVEPPTAPPASEPIDPNSVGSGADATGSEEQSSAAGEAPTKESLSPLILQLGSKSGPTAVQELFGEFSAKKFSEVPADKYVQLKARLDELLAA